VGEYWDTENAVKNWIENETSRFDGRIRSAAFDFPYHNTLRSACSSGDWSHLGGEGVMKDSKTSRYAVTFVDNHDTYRIEDDKVGDCQMAANAMILFSPGTPCVFLPHWCKYKEELKRLVLLRKLANLDNQSEWCQIACTKDYYAQSVKGEYGTEIVVQAGYGYQPQGDYEVVASGDKYCVWMNKNTPMPSVSLLPGVYPTPQTTRIDILGNAADAQIVYTTDGSVPSVSNGNIADASTDVTITHSMILTVAVLKNGKIINPCRLKYFIGESDDLNVNTVI